MKNFSAPKYLAYAQPRSYVTSHNYQVHHTTITTLKVSTVTKHVALTHVPAATHVGNVLCVDSTHITNRLFLQCGQKITQVT